MLEQLVPWKYPATSPDLTPLYFYFSDIFKRKVYTTPALNKQGLDRRVFKYIEELNANEIMMATNWSTGIRILKYLDTRGHLLNVYYKCFIKFSSLHIIVFALLFTV